MKRFAVSVVAAIMTLYAVYALGPKATQEALSTRTIAQEPAASTGLPDPFSDPRDPRRKTAQPRVASTIDPERPSEALESKLSLPENFEFPDVPLQDIVDALSEKLAIPFILDKKALEDAGIGTDKTVNIKLRGFRTDKFLDLMLDELELTWVVRDGYVFITTKEKLSEQLEVRVYNCSDLIEMVKADPQSKYGGIGGGSGGGKAPAAAGGATKPAAGSAPGATPGGGHGGFFAVPPGGVSDVPGAAASMPSTGDSGRGVGHASQELVPDYDSLIDLIQTTLEPDSWVDVGGSGSIESYHGGLLVINQDGRTHRRIELLLNMMRQAKQAESGTVIRER